MGDCPGVIPQSVLHTVKSVQSPILDMDHSRPIDLHLKDPPESSGPSPPGVLQEIAGDIDRDRLRGEVPAIE
jgi:hypothetical protein